MYVDVSSNGITSVGFNKYLGVYIRKTPLLLLIYHHLIDLIKINFGQMVQKIEVIY